MLPGSRNTNYGADSPVKSADLNDIQDCIVGNKHPELEVDIFAWEFHAEGTGTTTRNEAGYVTMSVGGTDNKLCASVRVPVGKRITTVEVFYDGAGDAATILPKLRKQILSTGVQADVIAGVADTGTGIESQVLTANHTALAGNAYFIEVTLASGAHRVHGAKVKFDAL